MYQSDNLLNNVGYGYYETMEHPHPLSWRGENELDETLVRPYIVRTDEETRIRVYSTQLMDTVIENITISNYLYQVSIYHKLASNLIYRFPNRRDDIVDATMLFWEKTQTKLKKLRNNGHSVLIE